MIQKMSKKEFKKNNGLTDILKFKIIKFGNKKGKKYLRFTLLVLHSTVLHNYYII